MQVPHKQRSYVYHNNKFCHLRMVLNKGIWGYRQSMECALSSSPRFWAVLGSVTAFEKSKHATHAVFMLPGEREWKQEGWRTILSSSTADGISGSLQNMVICYDCMKAYGHVQRPTTMKTTLKINFFFVKEDMVCLGVDACIYTMLQEV